MVKNFGRNFNLFGYVQNCIDKFIITVGTDKFVTRSYATVRNGWFFHQSFDRMPEKQIRVLRIIKIITLNFFSQFIQGLQKFTLFFIEYQLIHH